MIAKREKREKEKREKREKREKKCSQDDIKIIIERINGLNENLKKVAALRTSSGAL